MATPPLPAHLFTALEFRNKQQDGTLQVSPLFKSLGRLSAAVVSNADTSYYVAPAADQEELSLLRCKQNRIRAERNVLAMLSQVLRAEQDSRPLPDRLRKDLLVTANARLADDEHARFKDLFTRSFQHIDLLRVAAKKNRSKYELVDFVTDRQWDEQLLVLGSLWPIFSHGLINLVADNIMRSIWHGEHRRLAIAVANKVQHDGVVNVIKEGIKHLFHEKSMPTPGEDYLASILAQAKEKESLVMIIGECGAINGRTAYAELSRARSKYRVDLGASVMRLQPVEVDEPELQEELSFSARSSAKVRRVRAHVDADREPIAPMPQVEEPERV